MYFVMARDGDERIYLSESLPRGNMGRPFVTSSRRDASAFSHATAKEFAGRLNRNPSMGQHLKWKAVEE